MSSRQEYGLLAVDDLCNAFFLFVIAIAAYETKQWPDKYQSDSLDGRPITTFFAFSLAVAHFICTSHALSPQAHVISVRLASLRNTKD